MNIFAILRAYVSLKQNAKKNRDAIYKWQRKKLIKLVKYACKHSAYYKKKFEEKGIDLSRIEYYDLSTFPSIDKNILMQHYDEIVTDKRVTQEALKRFDLRADQESRFLDSYHVLHSSGSTGEPKYFLYDEAAWNVMIAGILRAALLDISFKQFIKWYVSDPRILFIAATGGRYGGVMAVTDGVGTLRVKQLSLDIGMPVGEWIKQVNDFRPNFIVGYPSAIKILSEAIQERDISLQVNRVFSCGEPLGAGLRNYLEEFFECDVLNIYGASESLAIGTQYSQDGGMILFDDLNIVEVENAEMYLTCLYNFAQPLIRYKMSDRLEALKKSDDDAFTKTDVLLCRDEDVLWFRNEQGEREFLHPLSIEGFCINGLTDYQFVQTDINRFEVLLELQKKSDREEICRILREDIGKVLCEKGLEYVSFEIKVVKNITPDHITGKKRLIVGLEEKASSGGKENIKSKSLLTEEK